MHQIHVRFVRFVFRGSYVHRGLSVCTAGETGRLVGGGAVFAYRGFWALRGGVHRLGYLGRYCHIVLIGGVGRSPGTSFDPLPSRSSDHGSGRHGSLHLLPTLATLHGSSVGN